MKNTVITILTLFCLIPNIGQAEKMKVGVQLWSVKDDLRVDFKGTIKSLAAMGFQGVELAGEYGEFSENPKAMKEFIESTGMEILGTHTNFGLLTQEKIAGTMKFYKDAGIKAAMISWDDRAFSAETVWKTIADLNRLLPVFMAADIRFGYHNHGQEFGPYRDITLLDHIARSTPDSFVMQLDVGWASAVGLNPADFVKRHPGRILSTHYKAAENEIERGNLPIIGRDSINWEELITANRSLGGTKWLIVEQEEYPNEMTPLEAVNESKRGLDKLLGNAK